MFSAGIRVGLGALFVALFLACSSSDPPPPPVTQDPVDAGAGTDSATTETPEAGAPDERCKQEGTACSTCCVEEHPSGNRVYDQAFLSCVCGPPGACETECAQTICAAPSQPASRACDTCAQAAVAVQGACAATIRDTCNADPDCKALTTCVSACSR